MICTDSLAIKQPCSEYACGCSWKGFETVRLGTCKILLAGVTE